MKPFIYSTIFFIVSVLKADAQNYEKVWFNNADSVYGYYTVIKPTSPRIQGALILMDGYGGNASSFLTETKIHNIASSNDFLTVCVPTGIRLFADEEIKQLITRICRDVIKTYGIKKDRFALGGFSSGGTIVLRYAELCYQQPGDYPIQPAAVFTGDSPVDLIALYQSSKNELRKNFQGWWLGESKMIIDSLEKKVGNPETAKDKYAAVSPFNQEDTATGNEQYLQHVAYRTYHDVDVQWQIDNRRRSIYSTNMLPASELVNRLVISGNEHASFIQSKLPGRRNNGFRHPHSWSIIDEIDLVQWLTESLHFYPSHVANPYTYNAPLNWSPETILFPFNFAATLPYKGFEELRFAPGWGNASGTECWAYTILWWLDDDYTFDQSIVQHDLETYFTGLTRQRVIAEGQNMSSFIPAKAAIKKISTEPGDVASYTGTLDIFDALITKKPGKLYVKIHQKQSASKGNTVLLMEVAATGFDQPAWQQLDKINADFGWKK